MITLAGMAPSRMIDDDFANVDDDRVLFESDSAGMGLFPVQFCCFVSSDA